MVQHILNVLGIFTLNTIQLTSIIKQPPCPLYNSQIQNIIHHSIHALLSFL